MKKQLFTVAFCSVLLFLVGLMWWRVRELEKTVESLRQQHSSNSTVAWQNEQQSSNNTEKKQVFKLIDSPPVDPGRSKVGVPWDVERAMMGGANHKAAPPREGEWHWEVQTTPDLKFVPEQPKSK
jgi:hypothetical protein